MDLQTQINLLTKQIIELKQQTAKNILGIGRRLIMVKESLPHGEWGKWLEEKVEFTDRTARKFMKVANEFDEIEEIKGKTPSDLGIEKLYILSSIKPKDREEFLNNNDIENMSTRELQLIMKKAKNIPVKENKNTNIKELIEDNTVGNYEDDKWVKTIQITNEIILKTGEFYNDINSTLEFDKYESMLLSRYLAREITHSELKKIIEDNNLNIPFLKNENNYRKFLDGLDISNSYMHYDDNCCYYNILETKDLSWKNNVEFAWEKDEKKRQRLFNENKDFVFTKDKYTIARGFIEDTEYICIYKDKELFAHYCADKNYRSKIEKLFKFYKINKKYMELVDKFINAKNIEKEKELEEAYNKAVKDAKAKFVKNDETYLLREYANQRDFMQVFKGFKQVSKYVFEIGMNLYNVDFYNVVSTKTYYRELVKNSDTELVHIKEFHAELEQLAKKIADKYKEYNFNNNNFWEDLLGDKKQREADLDIFTVEEKKLLKEILSNEKLAKKLYILGAQEYHPDKFTAKPKKQQEEAETKMKLLNAIKDKISG
ncbi:DUF3102 domain-containing protein [Clostridium sp. 19966]|uniref:DUF3102 domain-containing protein n=1 Tax=Clostridium sp. 19966 TaxID=2768166 RepID=UPI0028DEAD17|nr:DUF3102 domain-containing protein [Clostridium sp. 19966]MDT8719005.1 DUF3102 domain-containing protein [Clostridium sp. 19966]